MAPFVVDPATTFRLRPREQKELIVSVSSEDAGSFRGSVQIEGEQQKQETRLESEVILASAAAPAGTPKPRTGDAPDELALRLAKQKEAQIANLLYLRDNVKIRNIGSEGATVEWPTSLTNARMCRIELRSMRMDDQGHLRTDWQVAPVVAIKQNGDRFIGELHALRPGSINTIRIVPIAEAGENADPLFLTQIETLPPKAPPFRINAFNVAVFLLVVIAGGTFAWKRVHRVVED